MENKPRDLNYEQLQKRIEEENRLYEAKQKILRRKREERQAIKKAGGGKELARRVLSPMAQTDADTDFNYGSNADPTGGQENTECMGPVKCTRCGKHHGYCREISEDKEKLKMLPTGEDQGNRRQQRGGGLNFINNQDLNEQGQEAKILMVKFTEKGKQGPSITLKLAFANEIRYFWVPCRKTDARYATLLNAFGPNENNWVDQRILLLLEKDEFSEGFKTSVKIPKKGK